MGTFLARAPFGSGVHGRSRTDGARTRTGQRQTATRHDFRSLAPVLDRRGAVDPDDWLT
ncbi:hypothetical protein B005_5494 [Nocardiopsis alba ATCC BAA-2165]|jgi:hypothetical protein|uniref:Uncharacterized protein n=1 Tax=Nocardiopsis alba (strain ATCC BAA-2165 / BE74) TaxID=1205910 RepID=J7L5E4_NOCAA|nr:hypothetical protein B005_5494 [Nocardiopsis alba ATCC BAA-2165]